jgi:hypothetical protein
MPILTGIDSLLTHILTHTVATVMLDDYPAVEVMESDDVYIACVTISPTPMINVSAMLMTMDGNATGRFSLSSFPPTPLPPPPPFLSSSPSSSLPPLSSSPPPHA